MKRSSFPLFLARAALSFAPPSVVVRTSAIVLDRARRRHPKLFAEFARLPKATVLFEITDAPRFLFALTLGQEAAGFGALEARGASRLKPHATIAGPLASLVAMLEGQEDGDTLFFSRVIRVKGDTALIVALRNTLDRESIDLTDIVLSVLGPFAAPAGRVAGMADGVLRRFYERIRPLAEGS